MMYRRRWVSLACALLVYCFTASAENVAPEGGWDNSRYLGTLNRHDFRAQRRVVPAMLMTLRSDTHHISVFLDEASHRFNDKKFRLNVTVLRAKSSAVFQRTPFAGISQYAFFGDGFGFPTTAEEFNGKYLPSILDLLASALARELPGFLWKQKHEALKALTSMQPEVTLYQATI